MTQSGGSGDSHGGGDGGGVGLSDRGGHEASADDCGRDNLSADRGDGGRDNLSADSRGGADRGEGGGDGLTSGSSSGSGSGGGGNPRSLLHEDISNVEDLSVEGVRHEGHAVPRAGRETGEVHFAVCPAVGGDVTLAGGAQGSQGGVYTGDGVLETDGSLLSTVSIVSRNVSHTRM